ncbi:7-cyano-7-deazaguanine synthase [Salinivibrio costicola]|uniref:Asparagine synthase n=1 Tax=Salinivibrio costicola TaxID=51367 RepID=A0ABX6K4N4_SALCS|nr:7-cyano-7-deazaguanine synthase [Salinivibrio costicola]QIR06509.1 hypothetical protein HBA18_09105 [Salinivibrio costicola]
MTHDHVKFFLNYGYFPREFNQTIHFNCIDEDFSERSRKDLSKVAAELFLESISKLYKSNERHLVPLSGGFDSRVILSALMRFTEAKNIYAYSYGAKGTLDYEIGRKLAQKIGVNHLSFDMQSYQFDIEDLLYNSNAIKQQTVLFHNPPLSIIDSLFENFHCWSGIIGDVVAGSAFSYNSSKNQSGAILKYLDTKKYAIDAEPSSNESLKNFISNSILSGNTNLTLDEKLVLTERYENFYKPIICSGNMVFNKPFVNSKFSDFMFNLPVTLRENCKLYYEFIKFFDPELYAFPVKKMLGLSMEASQLAFHYHKSKIRIKKKIGMDKIRLDTNYFDFNYKYFNESKFERLVNDQIYDLNQRGIIDYIDLDSVIEQFAAGKVSVETIKTLVSLEVHLKNGLTLDSGIDGGLC